MIKPDYIIRTNRRSVSLMISKSGEIIVRAPKKVSMDKIFEFVNEKEKWITKHLNIIKKNNELNFDIKNYDSVLILGKKYEVRQIAGIKRIEVSKNEIIYPISWEKSIFIHRLEKFLREQAKTILEQRIEYFAELMQIDYNSFSVKNYKARWGCCSKKGDIIINYKAIMLPHYIIDYILIHELSHLFEFNHSSKFYQIVASVMSSWKKARKDLKNYSYLLEMN